MVLCAAVVFALTVYACTTKSDLTYCAGIGYAAIMVMFMISMFFLFSWYDFKSHFLRAILAACGAILMSVYLVFDI